jgi:hypothetical protein
VVIAVHQHGRGPWPIIAGYQVKDPMVEQTEIVVSLQFLSGQVARAHIQIKNGQAIRFSSSPARFVTLFRPLKTRLQEFVKFGSPYELDFPCLLSAEELDELRGLLAAEKAMEYLELSKTSQGAARRGSRETVRTEKFSEEDMFRAARAAKAIQKRTNRPANEGIGEYAGGWDADPELDIEDQTPTWPSKRERALGHEHPARHFRASIFSQKEWIKDPETGEKKLVWRWESGPVTLDYDTLGVNKVMTKKGYPDWAIQDVRGLKEAIYQELEWGDLLFWVESYVGQYGYLYSHQGVRLPSKRPSYQPKIMKPRLPCKQCGGLVWRLDPHAEVCDHCGSEGFPRNWINVLIPAYRLAAFCSYHRATTHIQIKLYGRAVGQVILEALRRGVNITKPQVELDIRPTVPEKASWRNIDPSFKPNKTIAPVGFGRFLFGPDWKRYQA